MFVQRQMTAAALTWLVVISQVYAQNGEYPADRSDVLEEFEISTDGDLLLAPVTIDGRTYQFVIDTGFYCTAFDTSLKAFLGEPVECKTLKTPLGSTNATFYSFPQIRLGRLSVSANNSVGCIDFDHLEEVAGVKIDGIIGSDVLSQYVVHMDFDRGKLGFLKHAGSLSGSRFSLGDPRLPSIEVEFPGMPRTRFLVDTGHISLYSGSIQTRVFSWLDQSGSLSSAGKGNVVDASGIGHGLRQGVAGRCMIAGFDFENSVWREHESRLPNHLSLYFLTQFNVTFDFPNAVVYLSKSQHFGHADRIDVSGLHFRRIDGRVVIEFVDEGSPADKCGIIGNDVIKSVNGEDASRSRLFLLRKALSQPGSRISLVIQRGSERFERELTLPTSVGAQRTAAAVPHR